MKCRSWRDLAIPLLRILYSYLRRLRRGLPGTIKLLHVCGPFEQGTIHTCGTSICVCTGEVTVLTQRTKLSYFVYVVPTLYSCMAWYLQETKKKQLLANISHENIPRAQGSGKWTWRRYSGNTYVLKWIVTSYQVSTQHTLRGILLKQKEQTRKYVVIQYMCHKRKLQWAFNI